MMLKSYNLSCTFTKTGKEYKIKFDVDSGVAVTFGSSGNVNQISLKPDDKAKDTNYEKTYEVTGEFNLTFLQYQKNEMGATEGSPYLEEPIVHIRP